MATYAVECIHCRQQVDGPLDQIGDDEAAMLREHLRMCAPSIDAASVEGVGDLLNHFRLTRVV